MNRNLGLFTPLRTDYNTLQHKILVRHNSGPSSKPGSAFRLFVRGCQRRKMSDLLWTRIMSPKRHLIQGHTSSHNTTTRRKKGREWKERKNFCDIPRHVSCWQNSNYPSILGEINLPYNTAWFCSHLEFYTSKLFSAPEPVHSQSLQLGIVKSRLDIHHTHLLYHFFFLFPLHIFTLMMADLYSSILVLFSVVLWISSLPSMTAYNPERENHDNSTPVMSRAL